MPRELTEYSYLVGAPRFPEGVMRSLAVKGDLPRELASRYGMHFLLEDLSAPEYQWTRRSSIWEQGGSAAAVAAQFSIVAFLSRATTQGRSVMAVTEKIVIANNGAAALQVAYGLTIGGTGIADPSVAAFRRDDRAIASAGTSNYGVTSGNNAASPLAGTVHKNVVLPVGGSIALDEAFILTNNDNGTFRSALIFVANVVNVPMIVGLSWRERELSSDELL